MCSTWHQCNAHDMASFPVLIYIYKWGQDRTTLKLAKLVGRSLHHTQVNTTFINLEACNKKTKALNVTVNKL